MRKLPVLLFASLLAMMLMASAVSAHVTVFPKDATQGAYEKFTVRVPSEDKESPTTKVELKFAANDVAVSRVEPKPGWKYEIAKDGEGKVTGITWTATDTGILATEFVEFNVQGKVGDTASQITWKAYQTYKNGTVVEWTGAPDAKTPASVTAVKAKPASGATDSHGNTTAAPAAGAAEEKAESQLPLYLSIAGLVLGALALLVALTKKAK
ncbi:YcnI family protein [Paenibacillus sp. MBLB4367]|uniref:YcnI family copper-binding membrane protein n=1 Tax=Paenibacillus sp. MBLB4367 TaxID=3384767 RepID=UPI0039081E87